MINYSARYKNFTDLANQYEPMHFKFIGLKRKERLPRFALLRPLLVVKRQAKAAIGLELTYFDLRTSLTSEQRKMGDLMFLTHFVKSHDRGAENVSRCERARYYWLKFRYLPELMHIHSQLYNKQGQPILNLPNDVETYLLRWGYMMSVPPDFVELLHGMAADHARDPIARLVV